MRTCCWIILSLICLIALGCHSAPTASRTDRPVFARFDEQILSGAIRQKHRSEINGREVWTYRPLANSNNITLLIPASSSNGISGGRLNQFDELLAMGFAQQGFSVIAYDVGDVPALDADSIDDFTRAIHSVIDDGGLADAHNAIAVASSDAMNLRIVTLGQGAASSLALRAARDVPSVFACVLINPPRSIKSGTAEVVIDSLSSTMPELSEFLKANDFQQLVSQSSVATIVFAVVPESETSTFQAGDSILETELYRSHLKERKDDYDALLANSIKITNPIPTELLPEEGFKRVADWILRQPMRRIAQSDGMKSK